MLVYLSLSINNSVPRRRDANGPLSIPRSYWKYPARTNRKHLIWFADFSTPRLKHFATIFQAAIVAQKFGEELSLLRKCFHIRLSSNVSGVLSSPRHLEKVKIMWFIITPGHGQLLQVVFIFHENEKSSSIILFKYHHTYQIIFQSGVCVILISYLSQLKIFKYINFYKTSAKFLNFEGLDNSFYCTSIFKLITSDNPDIAE